MPSFSNLIQRGLRSAQPAATAVKTGTLYHVTDEGVTERSSGSAWQAYSAFQGQYEAATDSLSVDASDSGKTFVNTKGSGTTTFTLPATVAGLTFTFVESNAAGEIDVAPNAADKIMGKGITAADDKSYVNTGATNAIGDLLTIVGDGVDGWWVINERGTWARET